MDLAIEPEDMLEFFKDRVTCRAIDYNVDGFQLLSHDCEGREFLFDRPMCYSRSLHLFYFNLIEDLINDGRDNEPMNMRDISGIYFILNADNDKMYVGQSKNVFKRCKSHFMSSDQNRAMYDDYNNGDTFIINFISCDIKDLDEIERYYIDKFNCVSEGYNQI